MIPQEHLDRLGASLPHVDAVQRNKITSCLVIEDFGTKGLAGVIDQPDLDGPGQNWNSFWFREGEGSKEGTAGNGGAGQGKITCFSASKVRTLFAYTVREGDSPRALFGSSSFLRDYQHNEAKWKRDAYWCLPQGEWPDRVHLPVQDSAAINNFCVAFGLSRDDRKAGLSLVIPAPKEINAFEAVQIVIAEFFVPIYRGDLVVEIESVLLDSETIAAIADEKLTDERARELHTCTTKGYRGFLEEVLAKTKQNEVVIAGQVTMASQITEGIFGADDMLAMRESLAQGGIVSVRFRVKVKLRRGETEDCHFDVHLACPLGLERPEQAVVRRDLLIADEPIGSGRIRQKVRGLTLVANDGSDRLSGLLLSAEEPTHLRWNARMPRLGEYYVGGDAVVAIVRNSMARLLEILDGGGNKRDFRLLSKYFFAASEFAQGKDVGGKANKGKVIGAKGALVPPPISKLLRIEAVSDGCVVCPSSSVSFSKAKLPLSGTVKFSFAGIDDDMYDPFDFNLKDESVFTVTIEGGTVVEREGNAVVFTATGPDFRLAVNGFGASMRVRMRLTYEEASDATSLNP